MMARASTDMGNVSQTIPAIHPYIGIDSLPAVNHQPEFAAATVTALTVSAFAAPVQAKPPVKPGPVTNLAVTLTKPADNFTVSASWTAATNATTYVVASSCLTRCAPLP